MGRSLPLPAFSVPLGESPPPLAPKYAISVLLGPTPPQKLPPAHHARWGPLLFPLRGHQWQPAPPAPWAVPLALQAALAAHPAAWDFMQTPLLPPSARPAPAAPTATPSAPPPSLHAFPVQQARTAPHQGRPLVAASPAPPAQHPSFWGPLPSPSAPPAMLEPIPPFRAPQTAPLLQQVPSAKSPEPRSPRSAAWALSLGFLVQSRRRSALPAPVGKLQPPLAQRRTRSA